MDKKLQALIADSERLRADFMQADLKLGLTFANLARTEAGTGEMPHALQSLRHGSRAAEIVERLLAETTTLGRQEQKQLEDDLKKLNAALAKVREQIS
jgi:hypothetical protein